MNDIHVLKRPVFTMWMGVCGVIFSHALHKNAEQSVPIYPSRFSSILLIFHPDNSDSLFL